MSRAMPKAALLAGALGASLLAGGCMPPAPARLDPMISSAQSQYAPNPDLKRLTVGVVVTENTRAASDYIKKISAKAARWGAAQLDDTAATRGVMDALRASFREVTVVASPEAAKAAGLGLVGIVDIYAKVGGSSFSSTTADIGVDFRTADMNPVAVVRGFGSRKIPYPASTTNWEAAAAAAVGAFSVALSTNAELAAYAAKAPAPQTAPAQAPAVAAAPAAPSYRSDVEAPAFRLPEDDSKFALVVGVESYQALPKADHAGRDARAVKAHLLGLGYPERNIILLVDQQAGKSGLEKYLESWLQRNTDAGSKVLFYFSGHGAPNPEDGQAYLMPWDGDPKFLEATGYPVKRLYAKLNALKAKKIVVAMDSCFSGTGGRSVLAKGARPLVGKVDLGEGIAGRVTALSASAGDEISGIDEASGHGLFTYQLLKALGARAGRATMKDLFDALSPKVRDAARRDNRDQTPQLIGDGAASL